MEVLFEELSTPKKVTVVVPPEELTRLKEQHYKKLAPSIELKGFRKGKVPRKEAEKALGIEKLYTDIIDTAYYEVKEQHNIVSMKDFRVLGDMSDSKPLRLEFIAEFMPEVTIPDFDKLGIDYERDVDIKQEDIHHEVERDRKKKTEEIESTHDSLQDFDVAYIDFTGRLEGEAEPFKGGSAQNFRLEVNKVVNGKKQFIDNFEDQIVGMKDDETREIRVTFPEDYRDKSKAGKKAIFAVTLKRFRELKVPNVDDDFAKSFGASSLDEYMDSVRNRVYQRCEKDYENEFKKQLVSALIDKAEFSPIPLGMVQQEMDKEWRNYLSRMGMTEEEALKKDEQIKEYFYVNSKPNALMLIKTSLVLQAIAKQENLEATQEEIDEYLDKLPEYKENQKFKVQYEQLAKRSIINEKVFELLVSRFKEF